MRIKITNSLLVTAFCCTMTVLFSTALFAQTFPTSCTSKDLTLLKASLPAPAGSRCACSGDRSLILGIHNGTGSVRTSFALWGTLVKKDAAGNILSSKSLFACAGPIPANGDYFLNATTIIIDGVSQTPPAGSIYPTIHIDCGESLDITNMHLAWTSATPGATCESLYASPSTINPKCGVQDLIHVDLGLEAGVTTTQSTCTTKGQVVISPKGGLVPYQVCLYKKNTATDSTLVSCVNVNGTTTTTATFTNLDDASYTATITDNMSVSDVSLRCSVNRFITIANPDNVSAPNCTVTDPACRQTKGTVNVTSPQAGVTYTLEKPLGTVLYTAVSGVFSNVSPDTYTLKATKGVCSATKTNVVVNNPPATPATPSPTNNGPICAGTTLNLYANVTADSYSWTGPGGFNSTAQNPTRPNATTAMAGSYSLVITVNGCSSDAGTTSPVIYAQPLAPTIVISQQPNLCSNSTGSISICSPNASYTYEISVNGGAFGDAKTGSSISFTGLAAGSNPVIRVRNGSTGCAATANCSNAVASCPSPANPTNAIKQTEQVLQLAEPTVTAYPNPFNDRVKFVISAPAAGDGSLDVYNTMGQKVKSVYQGHINVGTNSFELTIPKKQQATLIYIFRVGDKKITGKLLQLNN